MSYLVLNPLDIAHETGVMLHDLHEIMLIFPERDDSTSIVLCSPLTAPLFQGIGYEIIGDRAQWREVFARFPTLQTDPDFATQTLISKLTEYGVTLSYGPSPITTKRIIKTPHEIALLDESQRRNFLVLEAIFPYLKIGVTEEEIAHRIRILQLEQGASGSAFTTVVAFGKNTFTPHHKPSSYELHMDEPILIDMGLVYEGYCSDLTRCYWMGKERICDILAQTDGPWEEFQEIYRLLSDISREVIASIRPGMHSNELDIYARKMMGEYEQYFPYTLGHGIGRTAHEVPRISYKVDTILEQGMVFTIEPGIHLPDKFGARYEDMVVVTEKGARALGRQKL